MVHLDTFGSPWSRLFGVHEALRAATGIEEKWAGS